MAFHLIIIIILANPIEPSATLSFQLKTVLFGGFFFLDFASQKGQKALLISET